MTGSAFLLVRRAGGVWAIALAAVSGLARHQGRYRVALAGETELVADEIVGVGELAVRPLGAIARRFWTEPAGGVAVFGRLPVVVVDLARPPRALAPAGGADGEDDDVEE